MKLFRIISNSFDSFLKMYHRIKHSLDLNVIGKFPQSSTADYDKVNVEDPNFIDKYFFSKVEDKPITVNAILEKKAITTDLISVFCVGFALKLLISDKLKRIIENNLKSGIQFFESSLIHGNREIGNYWIMHTYQADPNFVDYNNSEIYLTNFGFQKIERIHFNSSNNFMEQTNQIRNRDANMGFLIEKLVLVKDEFIDEDFFILRQVEGGVGYFVSEKLKSEIEKANCTGIDFIPVDSGYSDLL